MFPLCNEAWDCFDVTVEISFSYAVAKLILLCWWLFKSNQPLSNFARFQKPVNMVSFHDGCFVSAFELFRCINILLLPSGNWQTGLFITYLLVNLSVYHIKTHNAISPGLCSTRKCGFNQKCQLNHVAISNFWSAAQTSNLNVVLLVSDLHKSAFHTTIALPLSTGWMTK